MERPSFCMHCFPFHHWTKFCSGCFREVFFTWVTKKLLLVTLDKWLSYPVTIVWELALADSALVVLNKFLSYGGGRLSRFDCTDLVYHANLDILWVLIKDSQTKGGQWSHSVFHILCILGQHHFW